MRVPWIDIAKGIGIFLVIFGHLISPGTQTFKVIFGFHMPLFFLLSGFVFSYSGKLHQSVLKVISSLIIPYCLISAVGLLISCLVPGWQPASAAAVARELFIITAPNSLHVGQIWFLFCLAIVQIMFIIIKRLRISAKAEFLAVSVCMASAAVFDRILNHAQIGTYLQRPPLMLDTAFMALFFFYTGYYLRENGIIVKISVLGTGYRRLIFIFSAGSTVLFAYLAKGTPNIALNHYPNAFLFLITSFSGCLMVITLSTLISRCRFLEFYGRNSLPIFSFHSFFLYLFAYLISGIFQTDFRIMRNIPMPLCVTGLLFVASASLPIPFLYKHTIGKASAVISGIFMKRKNGELSSCRKNA